jgi:hypothetical protein
MFWPVIKGARPPASDAATLSSGRYLSCTSWMVGKPEVIGGPRGQVPVSRLTGH